MGEWVCLTEARSQGEKKRPWAELGDRLEVQLLGCDPIGHEWPPAVINEVLMALGPAKGGL